MYAYIYIYIEICQYLMVDMYVLVVRVSIRSSIRVSVNVAKVWDIISYHMIETT